MRKNIHKVKFHEKGISESEIESTILSAKVALDPFLGAMSRRLKIKYIFLTAFFVLSVGLAIMAGLVDALNGKKGSYRWFWPAFILTIFLVAAFTANFFFNRRLSHYYRNAHFVLALFCRAENNRLYLPHGIEMRPGYNGLWVTFEIINTNDLSEYLVRMK